MKKKKKAKKRHITKRNIIHEVHDCIDVQKQ